jgi:predicted AlkP superfamily pyrophosphatase or phosphodiesterase
MSVVFILVDALRSDSLTKDNMPFLSSIAKQGLHVKNVTPSFGFCERTEIFTGMFPNTSGNFAAIGYDPNESEYRKYKSIIDPASKIIELLGEKNKAGRGIKRVMNKFFRLSGIKMYSYNIPLNALHKFRLTEDQKSHYHQNAFNNESIFDVLKKKGKRYYKESFTALGQNSLYKSDKERVDAVIKSAGKDYDLLLLYIGEIDSLGHQYTPESEIMKRALQKVDKTIKRIWEAYKKMDPDFKLIVLGDHGMIPVKDNVDILSECTSMPIKRGKDYEVFLDSTLARFWFYTQEAESYITQMLNKESIISKGFILDRPLAHKYKTPVDLKNEQGNLVYGDLIWCANTGVLITPNYFNSSVQLAGMHGYADMEDEGNGLLVISNCNSSVEIEQCNLVDTCATLCEMLDIPIPSGNEGVSLIK